MNPYMLIPFMGDEWKSFIRSTFEPYIVSDHGGCVWDLVIDDVPCNTSLALRGTRLMLEFKNESDRLKITHFLDITIQRIIAFDRNGVVCPHTHGIKSDSADEILRALKSEEREQYTILLHGGPRDVMRQMSMFIATHLSKTRVKVIPFIALKETRSTWWSRLPSDVVVINDIDLVQIDHQKMLRLERLGITIYTSAADIDAQYSHIDFKFAIDTIDE